MFIKPWQKLKSLFIGKRQSQYRKSPRTHSNKTPILFSPTLISRLKTDHQLLLAQFEEIKQLVESASFDNAFQTLLIFRTTLLEHLHVENLKLYVYLQNSLVDLPNEYAMMRAFRKEIDGVSMIALNFFKKYANTPMEYDKAEFLVEWQILGQALVQRIQREEGELYIMYKKSPATHNTGD